MRRYRTHVLTTLVITWLGGCNQPRSVPSSARVDQLFAEYNNPRSPGCSVAISRNGSIVYEHGYGMADLEWNISIKPTTVMGAASISKQFTAMSILLLAQHGKLSLDDDVSKYIPEWADHEHHVTIRHLLNHTSGLREGFGLLGWAGQQQTNEAMERMLARQHGVNTPAGTEFVYNNGAYNLLATLVKRVSGQSLRDFAEANIFSPLGMTHTQFRDDAGLLIANRAAVYTADEHGISAAPDAVGVVGNSGLYTTAHDLLLWENNFDNPHVGTPELLAAMQKPAILNNGTPTQYGFGLFLLNYRGQRTVEHSGGGSGISSNLVRYPDQKLAIALLCNSDTIDPNALTNKIADLYMADVLTKLPSAPPTHGATVSAADLSSAAGLYRGTSDEDPGDLRISVRDGKWVAHSFYGTNTDFDLNPVDSRHAHGPGRMMFEFIPATAGHPRGLHVTGRRAGDSDFVLTTYNPQAAELRAFGGQYWSDELQVAWTVLARDSGLMFQLPGQTPLPLQPFAKDAFIGPGILTFTRDPRAAVNGFIVDHSSVRKLRFKRMPPAQETIAP